jgi:hypothetical protein
MNNFGENENITFKFTDTDTDMDMDNYNTDNTDNTLTDEFYALLNKSEDPSSDNQYDDIFMEIKNYDLNFTLKQLIQICEYYNLSKDIKINKMKKQDIIEQIILFEHSYENYNTVLKRKEMWYYMGELKNDKLMKKMVIFL